MNILFDRSTLKVVGLNRPALPFEVEVNNVNTEGLTKTVSYFESADKVNENGKVLYTLPQESQTIVFMVPTKIQTIEVTSDPIIETISKQVPLLDENGNQVEYEVTQTIVTPAVYDEEGNLVSEETTEVVGTGQFIKCFTTEEVESQKEDKDGNKLYYKNVEEEYSEVITPDPLIITAEDDQFIEGLETVKEQVEKFKTVSFSEDQSEFTYTDIVAHKEKGITEGTFFTKGKLIEQMDSSLFSTSLSTFSGNIGFDFISIPVGGEVRTEKITLPQPSKTVNVIIESNVEGLEVKVGNLASDLQVLDKRGERTFDVEIADVYIQFKNSTDKVIDIQSIAILV